MKYKFRPYEIIVVLLPCIFICVFISIVIDGWQRIVGIFGGIFLLPVFIFFCTRYVKVNDNKIIINFPIVSSNSNVKNTFEKRCILFEDIDKIEQYDGKTILITLKEGNKIKIFTSTFWAKKKLKQCIDDIQSKIRIET